ncbi:hypothetical protein [Massilia glaciei]|uniref:Uncharacterized protein n=1 Tax=Massilia glaciei TaxID=1524097 RepID=A0A2U2HFV9_9BURK|nr:hypothetical protein [Massilia glaciei]PWF43406.1 hypothetical protein C7C56_021150 [Massilia glaciei]
MPALIPTLLKVMAQVSRVCGFETASSFPPDHIHARTRWRGAYFDIASDRKPEQIERAMCEALANTPSLFELIENPTPRMQLTLVAAIESRMRRSSNMPDDLAVLLIKAYASPHTMEAIPGMRDAIEQGARDGDMQECIGVLLGFIRARPSFVDGDIIDSGAPLRLVR